MACILLVDMFRPRLFLHEAPHTLTLAQTQRERESKIINTSNTYVYMAYFEVYVYLCTAIRGNGSTHAPSSSRRRT